MEFPNVMSYRFLVLNLSIYSAHPGGRADPRRRSGSCSSAQWRTALCRCGDRMLPLRQQRSHSVPPAS